MSGMPFRLGNALSFGRKVLLYDSKKEGWYRTPVEPPSDLGRECSGWGAVGANIEWKENDKTKL